MFLISDMQKVANVEIYFFHLCVSTKKFPINIQPFVIDCLL